MRPHFLRGDPRFEKTGYPARTEVRETKEPIGKASATQALRYVALRSCALAEESGYPGYVALRPVSRQPVAWHSVSVHTPRCQRQNQQ